MSVLRAPLHFVQLFSRFALGKFKIGVCPQLPIAGIDLILGNDLADKPVSYLVDDGVLMHHWCPDSGLTHDSVYQVVVPQLFRPEVLSLAHDHSMSSHVGIRKTSIFFQTSKRNNGAPLYNGTPLFLLAWP